jgi:hypothetical protein
MDLNLYECRKVRVKGVLDRVERDREVN